MKLEDFNALSDEEKAALLTSYEQTETSLTDLTAERDSLRTENESLRAEKAKTSEELKKTKELNFTLARKVDTRKATDPEEVLHNFIKGE